MLLSLGLLTVCFMSGIETETYKKVGGKAVLSSGSVNGPITSITWKHGVDIAVEWYGQEVYPYRDFKGRCELNATTGALTISNLMLKDSGSYTPEINSRIMNTTEIRVITPVPKPTISTDCNPERTECTLTCDASITKDTGPVIYSWEIGDRRISESPGNWINITQNDTESVGKLISCQLENPVGSERSDDIMSPFTNGSSVGGNTAAVLIALLAVIVGLLVHYLIWRRNNRDNAGCHQYFTLFKTRNCLNCGRPERTAEERPQRTAEETAPLAPTQNGGAPDLSVQETSCSTVIPTFHSPNAETFSLDNETHNQDQNLGPPDVRKETEVPKTTSGVQEELERDQTPLGSADSSSKSGDLTEQPYQEKEEEEEAT